MSAPRTDDPTLLLPVRPPWWRDSRLAVAGCVLVFLALALFHLNVPGLQYDEVLWLNAALGGDSAHFVSLRLYDIPVMLMPYIGALKAWLNTPVLALFDVNGYSVRAPMVLVGALTLVVQYRLVARTFAIPAALIFLALAALEPSSMFHTRLDWGPTTLMMLMRSLMLMSALAWIQDHKPRHLYLLLLWFALGLFDKLNFAWFGPAIGVALVVLYPRQLLDFCRGHRRHTAALAVLALALLAVLFHYTQTYLPLGEEIGTNDDAGRLRRLYQLFIGTLGGVMVHLVVLGDGGIIPWGYVQLAVLTVALLLAGIITWLTPRGITPWRPLALILVFMGVTLVELGLTRQAGGPHHMAVLAPLWLMPLGVMLGRAWQAPPRDSRLLRPFALVAVVAVAFSSLSLDLRYLRDFHGPTSPHWDPASRATADAIAQMPPTQVVTVDWGIANQLMGYLWGDKTVQEFGSDFREEPTAPRLDTLESLMTPEVIVVTPAPGMETFPRTRERFLEAARARGWNLGTPTLIQGTRERPLYEIYRVSRPGSAP